MKKTLTTICCLLVYFFSSFAKAQDSSLIYSTVLKVDSLNKNEIFDRTLIWCSKSFGDSKSAINVKEREGGIISGKGYFDSYYKMPRKKDSVVSSVFSHYWFDWLIEIKDNKLRFSITNIQLSSAVSDTRYPVYTTPKPPYGVMFQATLKTELEYQISKDTFIKNMGLVAASLYADLIKKVTDW